LIRSALFMDLTSYEPAVAIDHLQIDWLHKGLR
jgi:hypothetical protein